jgi:hypothetical protein
MSATQDKVGRVHELIANELIDQMEDGTKIRVVDDEGRPKIAKISVSAALLNVARQFVKDCGVDCDPENLPDNVEQIKRNLEDIDDEEFPTFSKQ